jgi:hypothetical protein
MDLLTAIALRRRSSANKEWLPSPCTFVLYRISHNTYRRSDASRRWQHPMGRPRLRSQQDTGNGANATTWRSTVEAWAWVAAFAAALSLAITVNSDWVFVFAAFAGGAAATSVASIMLGRAPAPVEERQRHSNGARFAPREQPFTSPFGKVCEIRWSAASEYFYAFATDRNGVGHRFASSPRVGWEGPAPPDKDSEAGRAALRRLCGELRERGWQRMWADGEGLDEEPWYGRRFRFVAEVAEHERRRAFREAKGLTLPEPHPAVRRRPAPALALGDAPSSRAPTAPPTLRPSVTRTVAALAGLACLAAPLGVALHAPPGVRLPAVLVLFTLAPGLVLVWPHGSHLPVGHLGLVVGSSLAVATLGAQLMLWLGLWHPTLFLYALAGACAAGLTARLAAWGRLG